MAIAALKSGLTQVSKMLQSIKASVAEGAELSREQIMPMKLRGVSTGALSRVNIEQLIFSLRHIAH